MVSEMHEKYFLMYFKIKFKSQLIMQYSYKHMFFIFFIHHIFKKISFIQIFFIHKNILKTKTNSIRTYLSALIFCESIFKLTLMQLSTLKINHNALMLQPVALPYTGGWDNKAYKIFLKKEKNRFAFKLRSTKGYKRAFTRANKLHVYQNLSSTEWHKWIQKGIYERNLLHMS